MELKQAAAAAAAASIYAYQNSLYDSGCHRWMVHRFKDLTQVRVDSLAGVMQHLPLLNDQ
jgi:hypothetical protein